MKFISTTALAKKHNITSKEMFLILLNKRFIEKDGDSWSLTTTGSEHGGNYKTHKTYGKYITWPDNIFDNINFSKQDQSKPVFLSVTEIGKQFDISGQKVNAVLSEIGWIDKALKGWTATPQGLSQGAIQDEIKKTGIPYVRWPQNILDSKILINTIEDMQGKQSHQKQPGKEETITDKKSEDFRNKFKAEYRSTDGHFVRSKAEMLIDNWLYMAEIVHSYERKLPVEEDVYSDFYIPTGKVYIEYWGYENDQKYLNRKKVKQDIYKKYGFNLIELGDDEVSNLDDVLPRMLLKHGIQTY